jgi:hypothetical protein
VFGSAELDLTAATAAPGASLDVLAVAGAATIVVPDGWRVELRGLPLLGTWENATDGGAVGSELVVNATVMLGSLDVMYPSS